MTVKLLFFLTSKQILLLEFLFQLLHGFVRNKLKEQLVILQQVFIQFSTLQISGNTTLLQYFDYSCGVEFFLKKTNCAFWNYLSISGCKLFFDFFAFSSSVSQIMSQVILALDARMKIQGLPSPGSNVLFLPIFCNVYYPPAPYKTNQEFNFFS